MTDNFRALGENLEQLRVEIAELRASRRRLVLATDAERRGIERDLHDGVQQHLISLAIDLQRLSGSDDAASLRGHLEEMERDLQQALDEAARLAQRIYPPLLEVGGLAAALRSAAVSAGSGTSVDVQAGAGYPVEVASTIYMCFVEALRDGKGPGVTVQDEQGILAFEVVGGAGLEAQFERLRDRVEALGGSLSISSQPGGRTQVSGSLPLAR